MSEKCGISETPKKSNKGKGQSIPREAYSNTEVHMAGLKLAEDGDQLEAVEKDLIGLDGQHVGASTYSRTLSKVVDIGNPQDSRKGLTLLHGWPSTLESVQDLHNAIVKAWNLVEFKEFAKRKDKKGEGVSTMQNSHHLDHFMGKKRQEGSSHKGYTFLYTLKVKPDGGSKKEKLSKMLLFVNAMVNRKTTKALVDTVAIHTFVT
ncbi:hypothetical protein Ancab_016138 [Ancistrocladus abbreviatus]